MDNHRGRSQCFHVWQVRDSQRRTKYNAQEHQSEAPMLLHHLYSLQIIAFRRFLRPQLFFPLPGGKFPFAEGNMWQLLFRVKSMGFNVLCLSHGLLKAQNSDLRKSPESAVLHQKHQLSSVVRRKREYTWEKGYWEGSNVKWVTFLLAFASSKPNVTFCPLWTECTTGKETQPWWLMHIFYVFTRYFGSVGLFFIQ